MTLQDTGIPDKIALNESQKFLAREFHLNPDFRDVTSVPALYSDHAPSWWREQFKLFRNRPLYPKLSAILYPHFGPFSMKAISAASTILASAAIFGTLLLITSPFRSALGVAAFQLQRVVLLSSAMALTDALALCLWVISLGLIIAYYRRPAWPYLVAIVISAVALTFTRPAFYLPLGASVGAYLAMRRSHRLATSIGPLIATGISAILYFSYSVAVHGPSVLTQIEYQYVYQHHHASTPKGLALWYVATLVSGAASMLSSALLDLGGVSLVLIAAFGAVQRFSSNGVVRICVLAAAFDLVALFVNPIDPGRPLLLPLAPLIVILCAIELERLWPRKNSTVNPVGGAGMESTSDVARMAVV